MYARPELLGARTAGAPLWVSAAMTPGEPEKVRSSRDGRAGRLRRPPRPATLAFPWKELATPSAETLSQNLVPRVGRRARQGRGALSKKGALGFWDGQGEAFRGSIGGLKTKHKQTKKSNTAPGWKCLSPGLGSRCYGLSASRLKENSVPDFANWTCPHPDTRNFLGYGYS